MDIFHLNPFKDPGASETIEEELGLTGATADDVETEYVRKICEHEIVTGMTYTYLDKLCGLIYIVIPISVMILIIISI